MKRKRRILLYLCIVTLNLDLSNCQSYNFFQYGFSKASLTSFKILFSGVLHSAGLFWYSACTKMPSNVRGQYFWVLNVHILGVKRAWSVPLGTQRKQKRLETCMACTREDVGPGPSRKLVPVKRLIISCLRECLGLPVIPNTPISR